jgi:hypothetical protein
MAKLKKIWIEHDFGEKRAVRMDWDNDRHQRIEIEASTPESVARALKDAGSLVAAEMAQGKI